MSLPFTAWEQAAIVGIFAVFVIAMMGWVYKLVKDSQTHNEQQAEKYQGFMSDMQDKFNGAMNHRTEQWQNTIVQRDKDWQKWMDITRERDNAALCNVAESVKTMTVEIGKLSSQIALHDSSLEPRVEKLINRAANGTAEKRA